MAAAFDLAAMNLLPSRYPRLPASMPVMAPSILKAVGWAESNWEQFTPRGRPLVSFDFGYGIMQVTSGMAGAFGSVDGQIPPEQQSQITSDYQYNIAYGARMLAGKWAATPQVGAGDPTVVEDWYYALWAYNGWGWVNNPNNPRFTRQGTPATNPTAFPYQERILYLVAHPPKDQAGDPLWPPIPVSLPDRKLIGPHPGRLTGLKSVHRQAPVDLSASYVPAALPTVQPGTHLTAQVRVVNTGKRTWSSESAALGYHLVNAKADLSHAITARAPGMVSFGRGDTGFPHDLAPGHSSTLHITVQSPSKAGAYRVLWDVQFGPGIWLSAAGVTPGASLLTVSTSKTAGPTATSLPTPREDLLYVGDTAAPDGTHVSAGQTFRKGWLVFNDGATDWQSGWSLRLVSGKAMGASRIPVPPLKACSAVNLVRNLRAPSRSGSYKSQWRLTDPSGHRVGDILSVVIVVGQGGPTPTPTPHAPPTPGRPYPTATPPGPTPTPTAFG